jgi:CHAD domain-containing protein
MDSARHWKSPEDNGVGKVIESLQDRFAIRAESRVRQERIYLDTFDWLLFVRSLALYQGDTSLTLCSLRGEETDIVGIADVRPTFAREVSSAPLRDRLHDAIAERALLEIARTTVHTTVYRVLNSDDKTVARLVDIRLRSCESTTRSKPESYLSLLPIRGYAKQAQSIASVLESWREVSSIEAVVYKDALRTCRQEAGRYSAKLLLRLDPGMRSDDAVKLILLRLLDIMHSNLDGIRSDVDIEFLHDYRVAVRKTRAALSQIAGVFPTEIADQYKHLFGALGQSTNALRDLDVYLLSEATYREMLPPSLQDHIAPLFDYLRSQRAQVHAHAVETIDSADTMRMLAEWSEYLHAPTTDRSAVNAAMPVLALSSRRIYRRYRRIIKRGRQLVEPVDDEELHALRIECKKLRYLLEFFASLYPPKRLNQLIYELRKLQDNLGEFNDLSVQQNYLMKVAGELPLTDSQSARSLVATGALVETLAHRQEYVKSEFGQRFSDFASDGNRERYRELFSNK